jgi:hypothetical protein
MGLGESPVVCCLLSKVDGVRGDKEKQMMLYDRIYDAPIQE